MTVHIITVHTPTSPSCPKSFIYAVLQPRGIVDFAFVMYLLLVHLLKHLVGSTSPQHAEVKRRALNRIWNP